jgi:hypothetical protein
MSTEGQAAAEDPRLSTKQYLEKHQLDELLEVHMLIHTCGHNGIISGACNLLSCFGRAAPLEQLLLPVSTEAYLQPV